MKKTAFDPISVKPPKPIKRLGLHEYVHEGPLEGRLKQIESFEQRSRRYLGCKADLVEFIQRIVREQCPNMRTFADVFAGTGVVGAALNKSNTEVITNDFLQSNYVCLSTFLGVSHDIRKQINEKVSHLNNLADGHQNYVSQHFGGRYFSEANARKIGTVREEIDRIAVDSDEHNMLLCSLIYAVDRVANTVGHYDAFRRRMDSFKPLYLRTPIVEFNVNQGNRVFCEDANSLVRRIECDVLYLDPPYNSRQYSDSYHLLENLTVWNKPPVKGVAQKMDRSHLKSRYCVNGAAGALEDLVTHAHCRHILLSYNNTGSSMDGRSNARITDEEILEILATRGEVRLFVRSHRGYTTGKNISEENAERIFHCRVRKVH